MGGWVGLRNGRMGGFKEWADGWVRVRGGYRFSSHLKQNKKAKICAVFCFAGKKKLLFVYL
jgi:hypothetical protein